MQLLSWDRLMYEINSQAEVCSRYNYFVWKPFDNIYGSVMTLSRVCMLFNDAVSGVDCIASVVDGWMNEHGALVEWYCLGETDILGGERVPVPLGRPQIANRLACPRNGAFALSGLNDGRPVWCVAEYKTRITTWLVEGMEIWTYINCWL
jgi:hypothetical protein